MTIEEALIMSVILKAYADGKAIEWQNRFWEWVELKEDEIEKFGFNFQHLRYRIKPAVTESCKDTIIKPCILQE